MLKEGKTVAEVYDSANAMADLKKIQNIKQKVITAINSVGHSNVRSAPQGISFGVPQGCILGSLFFILYVNDLNNASLLDAILFADDTNLFISHNDPVYLINTLNRELNKLSTCFAANRLSLAPKAPSPGTKATP